MIAGQIKWASLDWQIKNGPRQDIVSAGMTRNLRGDNVRLLDSNRSRSHIMDDVLPMPAQFYQPAVQWR
jgi:hypothetical protein